MSERLFRRTPGGVCSLGLHLVWCPKYRRRILGGRVAARCGELLEQIAAEHGWQIVAQEVMPDHVHLFVRVGPTDAPASVVRAFKGRTARVLGSPKRNSSAKRVVTDPPRLTNTPHVTSYGLDWPFTRKPPEKKPAASSRWRSHW
jgi:REP element-mobilizing transposase RayT